ncbi:RHS repeat-associated core domain-containing protein [Pseudomonas sp. V98_8]|jgi:RHS repeat-associated protein|uniref:RHS repeat-associated core domain-containing protein n=1 Tax=Pseudomonas sp. V98_8 TaxID=3044228 RepID=UPI00249DDC89|nr:RHS repeat-associated core domain-containing protein [Pseudomonas sp. V98_8]MDI3391559.1 RHS repeat-associated core domain-containing protein [Pseudomonas sp. V98_8]
MTFPQQNLLGLYRYDSLDRLIRYTQSQASPLQRFYCKSRLVTEIQGALQHSIVQHDDLLLAQHQRQDEAFDTTLLATDVQRSVLHSLKANHPRQPAVYSPYGHRKPVNGPLSLLGFNGERPDQMTGHYLLGNGYRAFNPVLMRFNSPDNLSPFGKGGLNSYAYCLGEPVNFSDPTGHVRLGLVESVKNFFGFVTTPVVRNIPEKNSLEGIAFDTFQEISQYLSRSDMDNLAQTSRQLQEHSTAAGMSNLKIYLASHEASGKPLHSALSSSRNEMRQVTLESGRISTDSVAPLRGVGSAAFKKLHPEIGGSATLKQLSSRARQSAADKVNKAGLPDGLAKVQKLNSLHAHHLSMLLRSR